MEKREFLPAILDFRPNHEQFNRFRDRASWLLLSLNGPFWPLAGTIVGTVPVRVLTDRAHRVIIEFDAKLMGA